MSLLEQHIEDHCHTAEDVRIAAHRARETRRRLFAVKTTTIAPTPIPIEPVVIFVAPDVTPLRDWLYCAAPIPRDEKWPSTFIRHVKSVVSKEFGIDFIDIDSDRRHKSVVIPRHVAFYLCKMLTTKSLPELARKFGNRDHTTILAGINQTMKRMVADKRLCQQVAELQDRLERDLAEWRALC